MRNFLIVTVFTGLFLVSRSYCQVVDAYIDAQKVVASVSPLLYGLNVARWDEDLFPGPSRDMLLDCDRDAIKKVKRGGFTLLKYPGGNDADHYIWNSPENSDGEMNTDEYAALLNAVGAEGFITVNFNESPQLAADWVKYCNKIKCYGIKYWEVGDEQWGSWARGHTTPEKYADRFIQFVKAMKE
jgi:Alpha-L-arabinofuranosidase